MKICELLGVEVEEEFMLEGFENLHQEAKTYLNVYKINAEGFLLVKTLRSSIYKNAGSNTLSHIINGNCKIVKMPKYKEPTAEELDTLMYYARKGYRWFAKTPKGMVTGFKNKPHLYDGKWTDKDVRIGNMTNTLLFVNEQDLSFIKENDIEPYHYEGDID